MCESERLVIHAGDADATREIGSALAHAIRAIDTPLVISLEGELGAGKTTFVGGFLNAMGYAGFARSPTYTLIEPYEFQGRTVFHLDLYRLVDAREVEALGLRDLLDSHSIFLIEWPDRGAGALPPFDLSISIRYASSDGREIVIRSRSEVGSNALQSIRDVTKP